VVFKQAKRISKKNTRGGTVYWHWADDQGSDNDILEMQFRGRTGSILNKPNDASAAPGGPASANSPLVGLTNPISQDNPTPTAGATKHYQWARLYQLTSLPTLDKELNQLNLSTVIYRSPLFPNPVQFTGFFNQVLDFDEVAERPFMTEYSFTFVVQKTQPNLNTLTEYLAQALLINPQQSAAINNAVATANAQQQANTGAVTGSNTRNG
jgi:hypothetical protein